MKRILTLVVVGVVAGILLVVATIRVVENRLIYFPPHYPQGFPPPQVFAREGQEVWLTTEDGVRISALFRPNPTSPQVLLWFHGNAENIGYGLDHLKALAQTGVNILAVDYRGYGKSEGQPDEAGVYHDADAAYDYLLKQRHFRAEDLFIYGHSLGGAVAVNLASRRPCGGLIVQSSFTNARAMAQRMLVFPFLGYVAKSRFDSVRRIGEVHAPVLIAHGTRDEVVPFEMGRTLYRAARDPKRFYPVEGAGHNDVFEIGGEAYLRQLQAFLAGRPEEGR